MDPFSSGRTSAGATSMSGDGSIFFGQVLGSVFTNYWRTNGMVFMVFRVIQFSKKPHPESSEEMEKYELSDKTVYQCQDAPRMYFQQAAATLYGYQAASKIYLYEAASFVREGLLGPMYRSVTWMLQKILGHFSPYVGLGQRKNYPLMRIYQFPPWEPDCSLLVDWILAVALGFLLFYSLAITFIILRRRRARHLAQFPQDYSLELPVTTDEEADENPPEEENGSVKLEEYWYPVGGNLFRAEVKFVHNGYEKIFFIYSHDTQEMKDFLHNGLPDEAVNGVFDYMHKHVISD